MRGQRAYPLSVLLLHECLTSYDCAGLFQPWEEQDGWRPALPEKDSRHMNKEIPSCGWHRERGIFWKEEAEVEDTKAWNPSGGGSEPSRCWLSWTLTLLDLMTLSSRPLPRSQTQTRGLA